jgi:hypothetical protein
MGASAYLIPNSESLIPALLQHLHLGPIARQHQVAQAGLPVVQQPAAEGDVEVADYHRVGVG